MGLQVCQAGQARNSGRYRTIQTWTMHLPARHLFCLYVFSFLRTFNYLWRHILKSYSFVILVQLPMKSGIRPVKLLSLILLSSHKYNNQKFINADI